MNSAASARADVPAISALRGVAISVIIVGHYVNVFFLTTPSYIVHDVVAIFFVLSGMTAAPALARRYRSSQGLVAVRYWWKRAVRIFPLYWFSLLLFVVLRGMPLSWETIVAFPLVKAPQIFWFVPFLILCYVLAPVLYRVRIRLPGSRYTAAVVLAGAGIALTALPYAHRAGLPSFPSFLAFPFGFVALFALGFGLVPLTGNILPNARRSDVLIWGGLLALSILLREHVIPRTLLVDLALSACIYASVLFFCRAVVRSAITFPFQGILAILGRHSYALYLLHIPLFEVLTRPLAATYGTVVAAIVTFVLVPVFLWNVLSLRRAARTTERHISQGIPPP